MFRPLLITVAVLAFPAQAETRCGWFDHPSPNTVELIDADGLWTLASPGAGTVYYAPGYDEAYTQAFDDRLRLDYTGKPTAHSYGFSCACVEGEFRGDEVLSVARLREIPMARCDQDPNLPKFELYGQN